MTEAGSSPRISHSDSLLLLPPGMSSLPFCSLPEASSSPGFPDEVPGTSASYFETSGSDPLISILHRSHGLQSGSLPSLLHNLLQAPGYWRLQYHFPDRSL